MAKATPATAPAPAKTFPTLSVIERRIASGDRNVLRPRQVALLDQPEPMTTRVVNTAIDSRWHQITADLGWVPVTPAEIAGGLPQGDMRADGARVVMGDQGREVLVKMPSRLYRQIQTARARKDDKAMRSKTKFQARVQGALERDARSADPAGAAQLERAAEAVSGLDVEQFTVSRERVPIAPPAEG